MDKKNETLKSNLINPPMMLRSINKRGFCRMSNSLLDLLGFNENEISSKDFKNWIKAEDQENFTNLINGEISNCNVNHLNSKGGYIPLKLQLKDQNEEKIILCRVLNFKSIKNKSYDLVDETTVKGTLHRIAKIVEDQNPGYKCSILLVADGKFVKGAGPSLPEEYNNTIDGFAIGPTIGSCGTAIYWGVPIIVENIEEDPLWEPFKDLAKKAGVSACWSHPFSSSSGNVLGALALYSHTPKFPSEEQLSRLRSAAEMTGLAVERGRAEEALRQEQDRLAKLLEETAKLKKKAEEVNNVKDHFLANISHEMRTPMHAIIGMTDLTLETNLSQEQEQNLNIIKNSAQNLLSIIDDVLDFSMIEVGKFEIQNKTFKLKDLLHDLESLFQIKAGRKNIEILIESFVNVEETIKGDPVRIGQVLINLINNAVKFTPSGGGVIIFVEVDINEDNEELIRFNVGDSGIGIAKDKHENIFDSFTQVDNSLTRDYEGAGLGLALSQRLVTLMNGKIGLVSKEGVGSNFYFSIPLLTGFKEEHYELTENVTMEKISENHKNLEILVVEDNQVNQFMLKRILEKLGHKIALANTGFEAINEFKSNDFDLILMDVQMPEMNGLRATKKIRELETEKNKKKTPIIALTAHAIKGYKEKCLQAGMDDYITKPVDLKTIKGKVASMFFESDL